METPLRRFPIGLQNFEQIRRDNRVYIDKTDLIYQMTHMDTIYFLSRPRRFGKSLLVSTLEAYFQGKKELFKGLAMERLETEWNEYPVLHMDFSSATYAEANRLKEVLDIQISRWEGVYGKNEAERSFGARFEGVIQRAYEKTGKQVVVLVDEYDSPLLDTNNNRELQSELRAIVRDFYSPLKKNAHYLRFLFLTGISKFSQLSIFSELNNLKNISTDDRYASICGITEEELLTELKPYIERMAQKNGETYEETCANLKKKYDGYHFSGNCPDIYNPFSLFCALDSMAYKNYWFSTGTPTFLLDLLKRAQFDVRRMDSLDAMEEQFDAPTETITDPIPVLYQAGYLTIKEYNPRYHNYVLGYPNEEVRYSFTSALLPRYGLNFDSETRTIGGWKIEEEEASI